MKQITFQLDPDRGFDHDVELLRSMFEGHFLVRPGSTVVEDVPDPEIVQTFKITRQAIYGAITATAVESALKRTGWHTLVEEVS